MSGNGQEGRGDGGRTNVPDLNTVARLLMAQQQQPHQPPPPGGEDRRAQDDALGPGQPPVRLFPIPLGSNAAAQQAFTGLFVGNRSAPAPRAEAAEQGQPLAAGLISSGVALPTWPSHIGQEMQQLLLRNLLAQTTGVGIPELTRASSTGAGGASNMQGQQSLSSQQSLLANHLNAQVQQSTQQGSEPSDPTRQAQSTSERRGSVGLTQQPLQQQQQQQQSAHPLQQPQSQVSMPDPNTDLLVLLQSYPETLGLLLRGINNSSQASTSLLAQTPLPLALLLQQQQQQQQQQQLQQQQQQLLLRQLHPAMSPPVAQLLGSAGLSSGPTTYAPQLPPLIQRPENFGGTGSNPGAVTENSQVSSASLSTDLSTRAISQGAQPSTTYASASAASARSQKSRSRQSARGKTAARASGPATRWTNRLGLTGPPAPPPPEEAISEQHPRRLRRAYRHESFPQRLYRIIEEAADNGQDDIIRFSNDGLAVHILRPAVFAQDIIPLYFRHNKMSSFKRMLRMYGFVRVSEGPNNGAYAHDLFRRGHPELCERILRLSEIEGPLERK